VAELNTPGGPEVSDGSGERLLGLLRDIEQRCLEYGAGLPQEQIAEETWEGVLFSVAGRLLVAPLDQVKEILNFPTAITSVPGTKAWVRGVANIRGNLLPIIDLQAFLLGRTTVPGRRSRVLVIKREEEFTSLLVDQMVGIKHFRTSDLIEEPVDLPDWLRNFVELSYRQGDEVWLVFSMRRLIESADFQFAAA
jgi:twitching motility protein PilI